MLTPTNMNAARAAAPENSDFSDLVLEKQFDLVLDKTGLTASNIKARFGVAMDISGSMSGEFASRTVSNTLRVLHAPATRMDDDGNLEVFAYNDKAHKLPDVTSENIEGYVTSHSIGGKDIGGYTLFAPVLQAFINSWFPQKGGFLGFGGKRDTSGDPAYLALLSDGNFESSRDYMETRQILEASSSLPIFVHVFLFGQGRCDEWREIENQSNVSVTQISSLRAVTDNPTLMYERLLSQKVQDFYKHIKG